MTLLLVVAAAPCDAAGDPRVGRRALEQTPLLRPAGAPAATPVMAAVRAQMSQPIAGSTGASSSQTAPGRPELPQDVLAALEETRDFAFDFDQPGFYALVPVVRSAPRSPGWREPVTVVTDWRDLLERPASFRGRPVTITGIVGHNKATYTLPAHPEVGALGQLELEQPGQPLSCTVILTEDASAIPLGSEVEVTGYFVMIRQYYSASGRVRQAALLVAPAPTAISRNVPRAPAGAGLDWRWLGLAVAAGLLVTLVLLRWTRRGGRRDVHALRARRPAPLDLSGELERWDDTEPPNRAPSAPAGQGDEGDTHGH